MRLRTYDEVWGMKRVFYHIERLRLPVPIALSELFIFLLLESMAIFFSRMEWFTSIPWAIRFLVIPFGSAWMLSRLDLEGRAPYQYFASLIRYLSSPKHWAHGRTILPFHNKRSYQLSRINGGKDHVSAHSN